MVQPARDHAHVQTDRIQLLDGRLAELLPNGALQPRHHLERGLLACGRRVRDHCPSSDPNPVEKGAGGPEIEPSNGLSERLPEQLQDGVLRPRHHFGRGLWACGRRVHDHCPSFGPNPVEKGARGPENELSAGAGTIAHDGRGLRRPARSCKLDILAPEAMLTDPLSPMSIEFSAVFDFVPSVSISRSYYVQEAQVPTSGRQSGKQTRWPSTTATMASAAHRGEPSENWRARRSSAE